MHGSTGREYIIQYPIRYNRKILYLAQSDLAHFLRPPSLQYVRIYSGIIAFFEYQFVPRKSCSCKHLTLEKAVRGSQLTSRPFADTSSLCKQ